MGGREREKEKEEEERGEEEGEEKEEEEKQQQLINEEGIFYFHILNEEPPCLPGRPYKEYVL